MKQVNPAMPNRSDRSKMVRWLFSDTRRVGGAAYLKAKSNDFLLKALVRLLARRR
jgi:hypothetical protein